MKTLQKKCPAPEPLNDSMTQLKKIINVESRQQMSNNEGKEKSRNKQETKCCESCKVKPSQKSKFGEIHCCMCSHWYHEPCVGIAKDDPVGIWLCPTCRSIPTNIQSDSQSIKLEVGYLKQTTESILAVINGLSSKIEDNNENVNDQLTSLQRKINGNDLTITETLEHLTTATDNIKTSVNEKTCHIINKPTAVFDKVKEQSAHIKNIAEKSKVGNKAENITSPRVHARTIKKSNPASNSGTTDKTEQNNTRLNNKPRTKKNHDSQNTKQNHQNPTKFRQNTSDDSELIDLTEPPRKTIKETTLMIGSSILKDIDNNRLKADCAVRSFPGVTLDTLEPKL